MYGSILIRWTTQINYPSRIIRDEKVFSCYLLTAHLFHVFSPNNNYFQSIIVITLHPTLGKGRHRQSVWWELWFYLAKTKCLKGLFTNFEYIAFCSCLNNINIFYKRSISIKLLWLEIIEKRGCTKSVRPSTIIYIIYITRTDFEHHFSQLFRVRVVLSRWTFHKKCFLWWGTKKMLYI